jgi:transketolase
MTSDLADALLDRPPDADASTTLEELSARTRGLIIESIHHAGAGHIGGPLSATDLLVHLYFRTLNIDPTRPDWPERDRFILSKGHSSIALYAVLALRGYLPVEELRTFDAADSRLQGHPDMTSLPGLDMSTGSLGQGLSPGVGMALAARLRGQSFRTWVMLGDGEIQEGQIWEAAFVAARYRLDTVTADPRRERPAAVRLAGAGGLHSRAALRRPAGQVRGLRLARRRVRRPRPRRHRPRLRRGGRHTGQPTCVVAHTVKGKGISFMEGSTPGTRPSRAPTSSPPRLEELDRLVQGPRRGGDGMTVTITDLRSLADAPSVALRDAWGQTLVALAGDYPDLVGPRRRPGQLDQGRHLRAAVARPLLRDGHR